MVALHSKVMGSNLALDSQKVKLNEKVFRVVITHTIESLNILKIVFYNCYFKSCIFSVFMLPHFLVGPLFIEFACYRSISS